MKIRNLTFKLFATSFIMVSSSSFAAIPTSTDREETKPASNTYSRRTIRDTRDNTKMGLPTVEFGGWIDTQFGATSQSKEYGEHPVLPNGTSTEEASMTRARSRVDSRVQVKIQGSNERMVKYGGFIEMQAGNGVDDEENGINGSKSFLYIETFAGKFEAGSNKAASENMRVDASTLARGTGGIAGDWWKFVTIPVHGNQYSADPGFGSGSADYYAGDAAANPIFILKPMLPNALGFTTAATLDSFKCKAGSGGPVSGCAGLADSTTGQTNGLYQIDKPVNYQPRMGWGSNANKLSYYTPRVAGLQFGVSWTPNTGVTGGVLGDNTMNVTDPSNGQRTAARGNRRNAGNVADLVSMGLTYVQQYDNLGVALSASMERGKFQKAKYSQNMICADNSSCPDAYRQREDLAAYAFGGNLAYGNLTIGASYANWGKSLYYKPNTHMSSPGNYDFRYTFNTDQAGQIIAFDDAYYYTAGGSYGIGPFDASVTYMKSSFMNNILNVVSFATDLKLAGAGKRGIVPFLEINRFNFQPNSFFNYTTNKLEKVKGNSGFVWLMGARLVF